MIVDPDLQEQAQLAESLHRLYPAAEANCFIDPLLALKYGFGNPVDALYAPVKMKRIGGFELGKLLRKSHPQIALHFIGDDRQEETDAMRLMADSYILRPVTSEKLKQSEAAEW